MNDEFSKNFKDMIEKNRKLMKEKFSDYNEILEYSVNLMLLLSRKRKEIENIEDEKKITEEILKFESIVAGLIQGILSEVPSFDERIKILNFIYDEQLLFIQVENFLDDYYLVKEDDKNEQ